MENKSPKILVLRIFNHSKSYDQMYDLHIKNDESLFVTFDDTLPQDVPCVMDIEKRIIRVPGKESFVPGIMEKTIKSIEFCLREFSDWNILIRSNISTVINMPLITKYFQNRYGDGNYKNIYGGHVWANLGPFPFVSGTSIILSRDLCQLMITNKHLINMSMIDDVSIGHFFTSQNIYPMIDLPLIYPESINWELYNQKETKDYFVRFRRNYALSTEERHEDVDTMKTHYDNLVKYK